MAGWLAGWLLSWFAGWAVGWLAGWMGGRPDSGGQPANNQCGATSGQSTMDNQRVTRQPAGNQRADQRATSGQPAGNQRANSGQPPADQRATSRQPTANQRTTGGQSTGNQRTQRPRLRVQILTPPNCGLDLPMLQRGRPEVVERTGMAPLGSRTRVYTSCSPLRKL